MVEIPKSLQPNGGGISKPPTVTEARQIKKYGSVSAAKKSSSVNAEIKKLGLDNITSAADYREKYKKASAETKKYLATPAEVEADIKAAQQKTVESNKALIAKKVAEYQERLKRKKDDYKKDLKRAKEKGYDSKRIQRIKDRYNEYEEYYDGIIKGLKKNIDKPYEFESILKYAQELGSYERSKERAKNRNEALVKKNQEELNAYLTSPEYEQDFAAGKVPDILKDKYGVTVSPYEPTQKTNISKTIKVDREIIPVNVNLRKDLSGGPDYYGQGTVTSSSEDVVMPTNVQQYLGKKKKEDRLAELEQSSVWKTGLEYTYDYGQGTQSTTVDVPEFNITNLTSDRKPQEQSIGLNYAPTREELQRGPVVSSAETFSVYTPEESVKQQEVKVTTAQPNQIVATPTVTFIGDEIEKEKRKIKGELDFMVQPETPTIREVWASGDQRSTAKTIFGIGEKPLLTGGEVTYLTGKVLQEDLSDKLQRDFQPEYEKKKEELVSKINVESYQRRINKGEDQEKVQAELNKAYEKVNKELESFAKEYEKEWVKKNAPLATTAERIYLQTQVYSRAKDTEAKVGGYFGAGAATGAVAAVGSQALIIGTGGTAAPILAGVGLTAGAAMLGYQYYKSGKEGTSTYEKATSLGLTEGESLQLGLVAGATELAPFAFGAGGALIGGVTVGGTLRAAQKPRATYYKVDSGIRGGRAYDTITRKATIMVNGKPTTYIKTVPQIKEVISVPGQRTETTTTWRYLANKYFDMGIRPISEGYPSQVSQQARALRLWKAYGLSTEQAQQTIQFIQPQVIDKTITGGFTLGNQNLAVGRTFTDTTWRDITVNKELGITTQVKQPIYQQTTFIRQPEPGALGKVGYFGEVSRTETIVGGRLFTEAKSVRGGIASKGVAGETILNQQEIQFLRSGVSSWTQQQGIPLSQGRDAGSIYLSNVQGTPTGISYTGTPTGTDVILPTKTGTPYIDKTEAAILNFLDAGKPAITTKTGGITFIRPQQGPGQSIYAGTGKYELSTSTATKQTGVTDLMKIAPQTGSSYFVQPLSPVAPTTSVGLTNVLAPAVGASLLSPVEVEKETDLIKISSVEGIGNLTAPIEDVTLTEDVINTQSLFLSQAPSQQVIQQPVSVTQPGLDIISPTEPPVRTPRPPRRVDTPFDFRIELPKREKRPIDDKVVPYYGEVKQGNKYVRVTDKPHTKSGARDVIARIIDNTVAAQGRVVPASKKKVKADKLARGDDYYARTKDKYRDFKIVKGRRVNVKNTLIEKRNRRSDTPGEKQGLGIAQVKSTGKKGRPSRQRFRL